MSNSVQRPPLNGVLLRGQEIVGHIDVPEPHADFLEDFNQQYKPFGLRVALAEDFPMSSTEETEDVKVERAASLSARRAAADHKLDAYTTS